MREAVIVASKRTPLGKGYRGSLNMTRPDDLTSHAIQAALAEVPAVDPSEIDDVIIGCGLPEGPSGHNVARVALLGAGLPETIPGTTVNRYCASGLQAIAMAAHRILVDDCDVVIGGGTESISLVQNDKQRMGDLLNPRVQALWPGLYYGMGQTAEVVAQRYGISREDQDAYALLSQQRLARGQEQGAFDQDIAPITVTRGAKDKQTGEFRIEEGYVFAKDEGNRPNTTMEDLAKLKPAFDPEKGTVTAGNSCQFADGAGAAVVMSSERAKALGIEPLGVFRGFEVAGCNPDEMGIGPVFAVPKLLEKRGLALDQIDVVELNEAFAVQVIYCQRRLGIPDEKLNPLGGSISIGHPYGMTGARQVGQLLRHMRRENQRLGIVTMCIGGGMGAAGLFEVA